MAQTVNEHLYMLELDLKNTHQVIRSFGVSGCWWSQGVSDSAVREEIARLLFDRQNGAGATAYRFVLGAGNGTDIRDQWRRGSCIANPDGTVELRHDQYAIDMAKSVTRYDIEDFIVFVNSPPYWMTRNRKPFGSRFRNSNLAPVNYVRFARTVLSSVRHVSDSLQTPVNWVSPVNEPDIHWTKKNQQEGCAYSPKAVRSLLHVFCDVFSSERIDTRVVGPEAGNWRAAVRYTNTIASDDLLRERLGALAVHSYFSTNADRRAFLAVYKQLELATPIWMSEWTEMQTGRDYGMDSALTLARNIIDDLTIVGVESWQTWIAVSKYDFRDGLLYIDPAMNEVTETKRLWAFAIFARFIRPGSIRVSAEIVVDDGPAPQDLYITAFRNGATCTVILVNEGHATRELFLPDTLTHARSVRRIVTSESCDLHEETFDVRDSPLHIPERSVTAFVFPIKNEMERVYSRSEKKKYPKEV